VYLPHSLGYYYTSLCQFIGFDRFGEEYKVMGLAAYGQPRFLPLMQEILQPSADGAFRLHEDYFSGLLSQHHDELIDGSGEIVLPPLYSAQLEQELGPARTREEPLSQRDMDVAASCQAHFEKVVLHCLDQLHRDVGTDRLVTAGGAALNGVCNARILRDSPFRRSYIQCAAGDDGTALGAALHVWMTEAGGQRPAPMTHAYWGPSHPDEERREAIRAAGLNAEELTDTEVIERTAQLLAAGKVVGWYQGRSEWGPRALGNRSILAHPGWPDMKDIINRKIKRRESFRPFAPSILADRVRDYFEQDLESPFMMHVVKIRDEQRDALSAVTHEDGTGRLHTVKREQNPMYYALIERFAELTGTPVLLNTSFNENEPIVDCPGQAIACYLRNNIDALALGRFLMIKDEDAGNPADTTS
jgi:carbamoyltransferase